MKKKLDSLNPDYELESPDSTSSLSGAAATQSAKELLSGGVKDSALDLFGSEKQKNKQEKDEV